MTFSLQLGSVASWSHCGYTEFFQGVKYVLLCESAAGCSWKRASMRNEHPLRTSKSHKNITPVRSSKEQSAVEAKAQLDVERGSSLKAFMQIQKLTASHSNLYEFFFILRRTILFCVQAFRANVSWWHHMCSVVLQVGMWRCWSEKNSAKLGFLKNQITSLLQRNIFNVVI